MSTSSPAPAHTFGAQPLHIAMHRGPYTAHGSMKIVVGSRGEARRGTAVAEPHRWDASPPKRA